MTTVQPGMSFADLERAYEGLADAIDRAGEAQALFLTKLALLLAERQGDLPLFAQALADALQDLSPPPAKTD